MTTTTTVSFEDLERLQHAMLALHEAGRMAEARELEPLHAKLSGILCAELSGGDNPDDDPEFMAQVEQAERDIAAGRVTAHEDVIRRLMADNG